MLSAKFIIFSRKHSVSWQLSQVLGPSCGGITLSVLLKLLSAGNLVIGGNFLKCHLYMSID